MRRLDETYKYTIYTRWCGRRSAPFRGRRSCYASASATPPSLLPLRSVSGPHTPALGCCIVALSLRTNSQGQRNVTPSPSLVRGVRLLREHARRLNV